MNDETTARPSEEAADAIILELIGRADGPRTISPEEAARALTARAHLPDADWKRQLPAIRRAALRLAQAGRLAIYRKGKPVDYREFRGVYRLGLPPES